MRAEGGMTVSVILPTYNRGHVVTEAVASVLAQTVGDLEVLVVDDGSTDDTRDRIAVLGDRRVRYVHQPNAGASAARNHGITRAEGDPVAFLDSDDLWKPDKLERELGFLARHPEADAVFADLQKEDGEAFVPSFTAESPAFTALLVGKGRRPGEGGELVFSRREMLLCLLREVPLLPSAFTIRRAALLATGRFDEAWRSFGDWEFFLRFAWRHRFGYIDRPLAVVRISGDSLHRVHSDFGRSTMLRLLRRERARLHGDREARAAIRAGIAGLRTHMGWEHLRRGERGQALRSYVQGFVETGDPRLLLRAGGVLMPRRARERARRLVSGPARV
jgi:glycosyltransferase involved in cell wall biosynthesis